MLYLRSILVVSHCCKVVAQILSRCLVVRNFICNARSKDVTKRTTVIIGGTLVVEPYMIEVCPQNIG